MSTRTIVEINHDRISDLIEDSSFLKDFLIALRSAEKPDFSFVGLRVLGQRHHSETLKLVIK